jgi:hypothetical protein
MSSSGHASQHDWEMGYSYSDGKFYSSQGKLFGKDTKGNVYPITTTNPKIYLGVGNCLIADQSDMNCMSLAWMNSGAYQFFGHVKPQSRNCVAWDLIKYFFGLQDRYTYAEAVYLNRQSARTHTKNWSGCLNTTVLYGDPAWQAHMKKSTTPIYDQNLTYVDKGDGIYEFTFSIKMNMDSTLWRTETAADFLPFRIKNPKMVSCDADECKVVDNLAFIGKIGTLTKDSEYKFVFEAAKMGDGEIFEGDKMGDMVGQLPGPELYSES